MYYPKKVTGELVTRVFDGVKKECLLVEVSGENYRACVHASGDFWGNDKPGDYGNGLCRTFDDDHKPARTGFIGQMAYGMLTGTVVDLERRNGGDKYDSLLGKFKIDVKCPTYNYGAVLVYQRNEWGKLIPLDKDIFILSYIESENREKQTANVVVVGFMLKDDVRQCDIKPGRKGKGHLNYELPFSKAKPIVEYLKLAETFKNSIA